jgi:hypothetical protein
LSPFNSFYIYKIPFKTHSAQQPSKCHNIETISKSQTNSAVQNDSFTFSFSSHLDILPYDKYLKINAIKINSDHKYLSLYTSCRQIRELSSIFTHSWPRDYIAVSSHFHAPAALLPGKEPVSTLWRRVSGGPRVTPDSFEKSFLLPLQEFEPVAVHSAAYAENSGCHFGRCVMSTAGHRGGSNDKEWNFKWKIIVGYLPNVYNLAHNSESVFFCPSAYFMEVIIFPVYIKCSTMGPCSNLSRTLNVFPSQLNTVHTPNKSEVQFDIFS